MESKFAELKSLIDAADYEGGIKQSPDVDVQFRNCLMQNISEGAIFVDQQRKITGWNRSAELITGLTPANTVGLEFTPQLLGIMEMARRAPRSCPVMQCLEARQTTTWQGRLTGRSGREVQVELMAIPVIHQDLCYGSVILLKDFSVNAELKRQLSELHNSSALDPLTHVANRAEFEKTLRDYVFAHRTTQCNCCLIVCDIDYFKKINDAYGHNVGDQALIAFAQTLKQFVRNRDVVARYGGEEFVILCANCDLEHAADRAEQIRMCLNQTSQQMLDGKTLSASFGVAELQEEEDVTTFFVRADKALYAAKQNGRNRVEKALATLDEPQPSKPNFERSPISGIEWRKLPSGSLYCEEYKTSTPATLLAEKLLGYVTESKAKIELVEPNHLTLVVLVTDPHSAAKKTHFRMDIEFYEREKPSGKSSETFIRLSIFPPKNRLFRRIHEELHLRLITEFRRYLMITDDKAVLKLNSAAMHED